MAVASAAHTLVLAYSGSALPLILYSIDYTPDSAVGIEVVATEIARNLIGTLGLILSVSLTTALAAITNHHLPVRQTGQLSTSLP